MDRQMNGCMDFCSDDFPCLKRDAIAFRSNWDGVAVFYFHHSEAEGFRPIIQAVSSHVGFNHALDYFVS